MPEIALNDASHWMQLRKTRITSTEVAALFGESSYLTEWMLYHKMANGIEIEPEENERMKWGKLLEPVIGAEIARLNSWELEPVQTFWTHPLLTDIAGASLDFKVNDPQRGPGILEIKCRDWMQWKDKWQAGVPADVALQVHMQAACTEWTWATVACFVGGNQLEIYPLKIDADLIAHIEDRIGALMARVASGEEPSPSGVPVELPLLKALFPTAEEKKVIQLDDFDLAETARLMAWAKNEERRAKKTAEAARAKILHAAQDAEILALPCTTVYRSLNKAGHVKLTVKEHGDMPEQPVSTLEAG